MGPNRAQHMKRAIMRGIRWTLWGVGWLLILFALSYVPAWMGDWARASAARDEAKRIEREGYPPADDTSTNVVVYVIVIKQ